VNDSTATPLVPPCLHLTEPGPPSPPSEPGFVPDDIDRIPVIYIAGPYSAEDPISIERNVRRAEEACYEIEALGACAICPHTNTRWQDSRTPYEQKCRSTMAALRRCDAVFWLPNWQQSKGARAEHLDAEARGKVMLYTLAQAQAYITVCLGVTR
jgi:hypothetical protein